MALVSVEEKIAAVELEIQKVQHEIDRVEEQLKTSSQDDIAYLRQEKDRLRLEKDCLRQEKLIYLQQQQVTSTTERKLIQEVYDILVKEKTEKRSFTAANTSFAGQLLDGYDMKFRQVEAEHEHGAGDPVGHFSWELSVVGGNQGKLS
jgi:hypothetical protein